MKKLFEYIKLKWEEYKENKLLKKRLKELRKRDPFIYK